MIALIVLAALQTGMSVWLLYISLQFWNDVKIDRTVVVKADSEIVRIYAEDHVLVGWVRLGVATFHLLLSAVMTATLIYTRVVSITGAVTARTIIVSLTVLQTIIVMLEQQTRDKIMRALRHHHDDDRGDPVNAA